ncbi:chitooligosaccharide deacetylase [Dendryphion nanum]|uniref:chitin deacetylase n=1 Tax=Dendryphion nanum TaxID=256645 RepID=A0A9P9DUB1_9PLEO|nr:chitooligosaccharide deacetylase [Dendryphion nanum]
MYRPSCRCFRLPSKLRRRARRSRILTMFLLLLITLTFLSPFYIIYKPPQLLIRYFQYRWRDVLWQVPVSEKVIALTIDDAPSAFTAEILQILEENGARATFFVIGGQVGEGRGREVLADVVRGGHELGNHAMRDEPSRSLSDDELSGQIGQVERHIHDAYDEAQATYPPHYFRPGSGFFSDRMRRVVTELKYHIVLGSIYPHDPQIAYPRVNAAHILSMVRPGGIVICHDRRGWTVPMLKKVLPEIRRRGYRITTVTGLLEVAKKEMEERKGKKDG